MEFVKNDFIESMYGRALSYTKDRREVADYDTEKHIRKEEAESIVENAEKFLERIKRAIKEVDC